MSGNELDSITYLSSSRPACGPGSGSESESGSESRSKRNDRGAAGRDHQHPETFLPTMPPARFMQSIPSQEPTAMRVVFQIIGCTHGKFSPVDSSPSGMALVIFFFFFADMQIRFS